MATHASLAIEFIGNISPPSGSEGDVTQKAGGVTRWANGTTSGQVSQVYRDAGTLTASGTVTRNLLAAGTLKDIFNTTIDLDEVKGFYVKCLTGSIKVTGVASGLSCFTGTDEGLVLGADDEFGIKFRAAGIAAGSIKITEATGAAGATYLLLLTGAE